MCYFRKKFCGCVTAQLIRSEAPLNELDPGTFFFTLYVDDFIESSIKEKTDNQNTISKETFRTLNDRYYLSTVKFLFFIAIYFFINRKILRKNQKWAFISYRHFQNMLRSREDQFGSIKRFHFKKKSF